MDLFQDDPTKVKQVNSLPPCGVCEVGRAIFYAPTKFGTWSYVCRLCSKDVRDARFKQGYLLSTSIAILKAKEEVLFDLVIIGIEPRVVSCPACQSKHNVENKFYGELICYCSIKLTVKNLYE